MKYKPMQPIDGLLVAKAIRNMLDTPMGYKEELVRGLIPVLTQRIAFFDHKRFKEVALSSLEEKK